jgi:hypothetical protein
MPKRVAKHRIELRVEGIKVTVMPGQTYDFTADQVDELDKRGALQPMPVEAEEVKPEPVAPKRGKVKVAKEDAPKTVDELDA